MFCTPYCQQSGAESAFGACRDNFRLKTRGNNECNFFTIVIQFSACPECGVPIADSTQRNDLRLGCCRPRGADCPGGFDLLPNMRRKCQCGSFQFKCDKFLLPHMQPGGRRTVERHQFQQYGIANECGNVQGYQFSILSGGTDLCCLCLSGTLTAR